MTEVKDGFLPNEIFQELQDYCNKEQFQIVQAGDKAFSVLEVPENVKPFLEIEGHEMILAFIRSAWNEFDTTWRRHADNIIMGKRVDLASVLYINNIDDCEEHGTAFYTHIKYGKSLPKNISSKEYDRMILEEAEDDSKCKISTIVQGKPNRLLVYNAQNFHGKFPNKIEKGIRKVCVVFYVKK